MSATTLMLQVQAKIQRVDAMIADFQKAAVRSPRPSLLANIRALEKEQRFLQQEFEHFAAALEEDVYRYRVLNTERPTLAALSEAWKSFQELFTATYQSLKYGAQVSSRKKKGKSQSEPIPTGPLFGWGYSYQGSVGVGLTLPRRDGLLDDPEIEAATNIIFNLASSTSEGVTEEARRLGPATVNAMFKWAEVHARNDFGVGIEWRRDLSSVKELVLPVEKVVDLRDALAKTTIETHIMVTGELVSVNSEEQTYKLYGDDGEAYSGPYTDAISREHTAVLPARHSATIRKISKAVLLPNEEDIPEFRLIRLSQIGSTHGS